MLTIKQIDAAKPKDKPYRQLDSNGLYLYVPVTGKKVCQLRYKLDGKEKVLTVGKYPLMSLQEARDKQYLSMILKYLSLGRLGAYRCEELPAAWFVFKKTSGATIS